MGKSNMLSRQRKPPRAWLEEGSWRCASAPLFFPSVVAALGEEMKGNTGFDFEVKDRGRSTAGDPFSVNKYRRCPRQRQPFCATASPKTQVRMEENPSKAFNPSGPSLPSHFGPRARPSIRKSKGAHSAAEELHYFFRGSRALAARAVYTLALRRAPATS